MFVFLVQVRVYSLNEELRKSRRTVTLTFVVSVSLHGFKLHMIYDFYIWTLLMFQLLLGP